MENYYVTHKDGIFFSDVNQTNEEYMEYKYKKVNGLG